MLVPVGADEKLTGWYIGEKRYETVSKADFPAGSDTLTLTAKVEKGHWIHFNSDGGSYVAPQFVTGNTIQPADPARPGFSFEGWYEESGNRFTFGSQLTSNITLTAHWEKQYFHKVHRHPLAGESRRERLVLTRNGNKDRRDRRTDSGYVKKLSGLHRTDHHPADHQRRRLNHRQCLL
ncbi:MAG: InlB B-repeat-containing protein [Oscillospiraceae bacterium]